MTNRSIYIITAAIILIIEIAIAIGSPGESFIRGSIGDILVIVLIYCILRAASGLSPLKAAVSTVAFGFLVEMFQYIKIAEFLGFQPGSIFYIIIGNTFSLQDLLMYLLGGFLALTIDRYALIPLKNKRTH